MSASREISVYDRMCWPTAEIEHALALGAHRRELLAYFGRRDYALLTNLAREAELARTRTRRAGGGRRARQRVRIYLLPGMLGSQLGWLRASGEPPDLLWLDPADVMRGRLTGLRWGRGRDRGQAVAAGLAQGGDGRLRTLGVLPYTYLPLKLRLTAAGFDVVMHDYDWRCDLEALARALAQRLQSDSAEQLVLIGHSMGGLLARAVLSHCSDAGGKHRIRTLIGLGAPHGGAIGAAQVLRATYPVLLRLAAMDHIGGAETLRTIFRGFASLYQMLPQTTASLDLFRSSSWPKQARPDAKLLAAARSFSAALPPADERFVSIVGTGQRTVTGIERLGAQFRYEVSAAGDGTVPAAHATLAGARSYSLRCEHSELPRSARVAAAILDLLQQGHTSKLHYGVRARPGRRVYVTDAALRRALGHKIDWHRLSAAARRRYLNALNAPPAAYQPHSGAS